ncbi:MAG: class I SAM-dependent methyltransferase [Verrucomicrobia bacterium]|nr:class I SAM-dependent methyltransferase [Verrucomicrobiota bacterium]MBI3869589.1 class I SAM-dependent methyltransferase [Verrucomicrobiota bacterium]
MSDPKPHEGYYHQNDAYAEFLAGWDPAFYGKYTRALRPAKPGGRALDVGCGVGQVVEALTRENVEAYGVDVSEPNIARARKFSERCQLYDGRRLPFPDGHFDSVGALNVLEHVDEPEAFLKELARVTAIGGRIVVSSPNFRRAIGFRDYHPRMRGLRNKWENWRRIREKRRQMAEDPGAVRFDRTPPIVKEPFEPDDDAIILTNAVEIEFFLRSLGCEIQAVHCTDRVVPAFIDWCLNATPLRYYMFSAFVVGRKAR